MFNSGQAEQNSENGKRSLAEWLRTVTRDLFQSPQDAFSSEAAWYAGQAAAPQVVGPADAAEFTGQISRLQIVLEAAGEPSPKSRRAETNGRPPSYAMIPLKRTPPGQTDSRASL